MDKDPNVFSLTHGRDFDEVILSVGDKSQLLKLRIQTNQVKTNGIVDTGATACCISVDLANKLKVKVLPDKTRLLQVNSVTYPAGHCFLDITINNITHNNKFFVLQHFGEQPLLGLDICRKFGMIIDLANNSIKINDNEVLCNVKLSLCLCNFC